MRFTAAWPKITPYWQRLAECAARARQRGDVGRSLKLYDRALRRMDTRVDPARMAAVLHNRSFAQMYAGQGERARDSLTRARDLLTDRPDAHGTTELAAVLSRLGAVELELGQLAAAGDAQRQAVDLYRQIGDNEGLAGAFVDLGLVLKDERRLTRARAELSAGLSLAREHRHARITGNALTGLGLVHELLNQLDTAVEMYQQALTAYREADDRANESTVYHNLGVLFDKRGDRAAAVNYFKLSYEIDDAEG